MTMICSAWLATAVWAQSGMALRLDGVDGQLAVADHGDLDIDAGESFTVTLWMKTNGATDFHRLVSKRAAGNAAGYEMILQQGGGTYGMNLRSVANANAGPPFGTIPVADGNWHHLAMRVDAAAGTAAIFVDGVLDKSQASSVIGTQSFANDAALLLGRNISQSFPTDGWLDDVRIWSAALSAAEIEADQTAVVTGDEPSLLAAWDFENASGNTVPDLTGNHPGSLSGGAYILPVNGDMALLGAAEVPTVLPVGRGAADERVIGVHLTTQGGENPLVLTELQVELAGTSDLSDLLGLKVWFTGASPRFSDAVLFGTIPPGAGILPVTGNQALSEGNNYFWVTADLAADAVEGNLLRGSIPSVRIAGTEQPVAPSGDNAGRLVILAHRLLFSAGDGGVANYRIPAVETAADQSVVVAADARVDQAGDLPNNVDIVVRRSTDKGQTWSDPVTVADFGASGASDPALVLDRQSGDLLCLFASHVGLFQSTPGNPIRFQVSRSQDNGQTWSTPQDATAQIYDPSWSAAWLASGSAHQLRSGRIAGVVGVWETSANSISNFMIYSDDGGQSWSWQPQVASTVGDEAKLVELDNGDILMNIRNQTPDRRRIVRSTDGGQTWGSPTFQEELVDPFVNGDLIRYTSVLDGFDKSRLLFSIAAHPTSRRNLTLFLSYDEGNSWPVSKVLHSGASGYASLTVLGDGSIGCFYENGEYESYQLYFARVSLDWLTDGNDAFSPATKVPDAAPGGFRPMLSPNPADTTVQLTFELPASTWLRADLYTADGRKVMGLFREYLSAGAHSRQLAVDGVPAGTYFVRFEGDGWVHTSPLVVQ